MLAGLQGADARAHIGSDGVSPYIGEDLGLESSDVVGSECGLQNRQRGDAGISHEQWALHPEGSGGLG